MIGTRYRVGSLCLFDQEVRVTHTALANDSGEALVPDLRNSGPAR